MHHLLRMAKTNYSVSARGDAQLGVTSAHQVSASNKSEALTKANILRYIESAYFMGKVARQASPLHTLL